MRPILFLLATLLSFSAFAQSEPDLSSDVNLNSHPHARKVSKTSYLGPGLGLDYAGMGFKFEVYPIDWISLFGSMGTNFYGMGLNGGFSLKLLPRNRLTPTLQGMYGYNGMLLIKDADTKTTRWVRNYNGFSTGVGVDINVGNALHKVAAGLWVPFHTSAYKEDYSTKNATGSPVAFSLGVKFAFL